MQGEYTDNSQKVNTSGGQLSDTGMVWNQGISNSTITTGFIVVGCVFLLFIYMKKGK